MIPKTFRLPKNNIKQVLHKGQRLDEKYFSYKYIHSNKKVSRFCVIVSSKVDAKAVKRNLLRRRIYETIRLNKEILSAACDIIIIAKKGATEIKFEELTQEITKSLKKIK
ncbi:ribonuclease P protein component [Pseudomonadota bacterium]